MHGNNNNFRSETCILNSEINDYNIKTYLLNFCVKLLGLRMDFSCQQNSHQEGIDFEHKYRIGDFHCESKKLISPRAMQLSGSSISRDYRTDRVSRNLVME